MLACLLAGLVACQSSPVGAGALPRERRPPLKVRRYATERWCHRCRLTLVYRCPPEARGALACGRCGSLLESGEWMPVECHERWAFDFQGAEGRVALRKP
ncbi:MAG: hypothetical protein AB7N76_26800 [Planctomycetota bacterium]